MAQEIAQYTAGFSLNTKGVEEQIKSINYKINKELRNVSIGAGALLGYGIKKAIDFETIKSQLGVAFQDQNIGDMIFGDLREFSAKSHIALDSLGKMTVQLQGFGVASKDNVLETMNMLGDLTHGQKQQMESLAYVLGEVKAQGKLMGNHVNQFITAGVPLWALLEKSTGKSRAELHKMGVSFEQVDKALKDATKQGGMFFGGMDAASHTTSGKIASLKTNFDAMAEGLSKAVLPAFQGFIDGASMVVHMFNGLSTETQKAIGYFLEFAALIYPLSKIIGVLDNITKSIKGLSTALNGNVIALLASLGVMAVQGVVSSVNDIKKDKDYQDWLKSDEGKSKESSYDPTVLGDETPRAYYLRMVKPKIDAEKAKQIEQINKDLEKDKAAFSNRKITQDVTVKLTGDVKTDSKHIKDVISRVLNSESDMTAVALSQRRLELGLTE